MEVPTKSLTENAQTCALTLIYSLIVPLLVHFRNGHHDWGSEYELRFQWKSDMVCYSTVFIGEIGGKPNESHFGACGEVVGSAGM